MTRQGIAWAEDIPALKIEAMEGGCVIVECEDPFGNGDASIALHPVHLRLIAEKMGLVAPLADTEAHALLMVDKLARRMRVLHERIKQVHLWMWENKSFDQCDINIEAWYIDATLDLSSEFLTEIDESRAVVTPRGAMATRSGGDGNGHQGAMANGSRGDSKPSGNPRGAQQETKENPVGSRAPNPPFGAAENPPSVATRTPLDHSPKACANPSGKASAKASVKASEPRTDSLFGGGHE